MIKHVDLTYQTVLYRWAPIKLVSAQAEEKDEETNVEDVAEESDAPVEDLSIGVQVAALRTQVGQLCVNVDRFGNRFKSFQDELRGQPADIRRIDS